MSPSAHQVPLSAAVAIVAGNMVGTAIFMSLGFQVQQLPSGFLIMLVWALGGVLAFCGAVNYAELSAAFPRSGGEYQLLSQIYHPGVGFVAGWVSIVAAFPAPVAAAALVFGRHLCELSGSGADLHVKLAAAGLVITVTGAHLITVMFSGRFQWLATAAKVLLLLVLAVCGFILPSGQEVEFLPKPSDADSHLLAPFFVQLIWVLYAYCGWNAACYIASEVKNPERNVPRALLIGTAIVTALYLAVNAAMLHAVPAAELARGGDRLGYLAAMHTFGEPWGRLVAALIAAGLASAVSAMTWAGPRVSQQMGVDYPFLSVLARTNRGGVPVVAVLLQGALALVLIFTFDVEAIVMRTSFLLQAVLLLTVWGVIHLRIRRPDLPRPYRAWGYPWTTVLFLILVAMTLAYLQYDRPDDVRWGLGILVTGIAFYFLAKTPVKAQP